MSKKRTDKPRGRTTVKELPKKQKQLSEDEQKKVKGGTTWTVRDTCSTTDTSVKAPQGSAGSLPETNPIQR